MAEKNHLLEQLEQLALVMDENINGVQIGLYSIAIAGLVTATRRVRPFTRFTRPSDIPKRFIRTRTRLNGTVERIEPNGALLMVQHKPLFRISPTKVDSLPVKISGININSNGMSWLQTIVSGNKISFIPVLIQKNCVECEVTLDQETKEKKINTLYVGPTLVSIGFGSVDPLEKSLAKDGFHLAYYKTLKDAEIISKKKRLGTYKYYAKSTEELTLKLAKLLLTSTLALVNSRAKAVKPSKSTNATVKPIETLKKISVKSDEKISEKFVNKVATA